MDSRLVGGIVSLCSGFHISLKKGLFLEARFEEKRKFKQDWKKMLHRCLKIAGTLLKPKLGMEGADGKKSFFDQVPARSLRSFAAFKAPAALGFRRLNRELLGKICRSPPPLLRHAGGKAPDTKAVNSSAKQEAMPETFGARGCKIWGALCFSPAGKKHRDAVNGLVPVVGKILLNKHGSRGGHHGSI